MATYLAIDFETANENRNSPCAIGALRVEDGRVAAKWSTLIDPQVSFNPMNVSIHGIASSDVIGAPTFPTAFERLLDLAYGCEALVAHSAAFDLSVLQQTMLRYGLEGPEMSFACTRVFARRWWEGWPSYSLMYTAGKLGVLERLDDLQHHNALWDATASMMIAEQGLNERGANSWAEAGKAVQIRLGSIRLGDYRGCVGSTGPIDPQRSVEFDPDPEHPLFELSVCFTGTLMQFTRREAAQRVVDAGGRYSSSVTKQTDLLVVGEQDLAQLNGHEVSSKMRKAAQMAAAGHRIEVIDEADLYQLLMR